VLEATEDTFHYNRCGQLRPSEAAELSRRHKAQGSVIRHYIIWRNRHADDQRLRTVVASRANVA
jgi:hypothetical protein